MKITLRKYAEALVDSLKDSKDSSVSEERIQNFLKMIQRRKKGRMLKRFPDVFKKIWREKNGEMEATVVLPYEPSAKELETVSGYLEEIFHKKVILSVIADSKVIGGVKIVAGDYIIDGTVKKNLDILKQKLAN